MVLNAPSSSRTRVRLLGGIQDQYEPHMIALHHISLAHYQRLREPNRIGTEMNAA